MKPPARPSFTLSVVQGLRLAAPWWLLGFIGSGINALVDAPACQDALKLLVYDLAFGLFVVFILLETRSAQSCERVDVRGAARNLYWALWWPWFVIRWLKHRR